MKPNRNETLSVVLCRAPGILAACFLLTAGLLLAACQQKIETPAMMHPAAGFTGNYTLVAVDGAKVPATVLHHGASMIVHSGTFRISTDGTCRSKTIFSPQPGNEISRVVDATYIRNGSELKMQWEGAGQTTGTIEGDTFTMDNHGMIFKYRK